MGEDAQHNSGRGKKTQKNDLTKMTDEAKLALHDLFLAYLIQSADAMNSTTKALESDPLQTSPVALLNDSLDSAKILLTKVQNPPVL
jgi:hypothetical protein